MPGRSAFNVLVCKAVVTEDQPDVRNRGDDRPERASGQLPAGRRAARWPRPSIHRGPDEDGFLERPGLDLANRRLSIVGLADGQQPIANEDRTVWTVFNGEFFDYPEKRPQLEAKGHVFRTHTDTELIPHLWEDYREKMFDHLQGQFAFCVWDSRTNEIVLARDRAGICPLFYTVAQARRHRLAAVRLRDEGAVRVRARRAEGGPAAA